MQNNWGFSGALALKVRAHRLCCKSLLPLQPGEAERLGHQGRHRGAQRYAAPVEQKSNLIRNGYWRCARI